MPKTFETSLTTQMTGRLQRPRAVYRRRASKCIVCENNTIGSENLNVSSNIAVGRLSLSERHLPFLAIIAALASAVRLVGLGRYGLDGDEIFSVTTASASWPDLFAS